MFRVSVKSEFDAAHKLEGHPGKCSRLHGHTWIVEMAIMKNDVDENGFVLDFDKAGALLEEVVSEYDHRYLNEIPPFDNIQPTAEHLSRVIFQQLAGKIESMPEGVKLDFVKVWESSTNWASFSLE